MDAAVFELNSRMELKHWWFVARRQILSELVDQLLPPDPANTIVDVGCGTGGNISIFANRYRCVGVDPSPHAIRLARRRFPAIEFIEGYAPKDLTPSHLRADLFMLNDVLEHVADDFHVLSTLLAAARPGTLFVLTVPADMSLWSPHDEIHGHYRRYTADRLQVTWEGLPVTCMLCSHFNSRLYPIIKLIRLLNRSRQSSSGECGTDLRMPHPWINRRLTKIFEGESRRLKRLLSSRSGRVYRHGVSLLAVLRRDSGHIAPRVRPEDLADDILLRRAA